LSTSHSSKDKVRLQKSDVLRTTDNDDKAKTTYILLYFILFNMRSIFEHTTLCFWVTACKTVHPVLSNHCLSCLCVMLVYCGQTVGWIRMPLSMEVGVCVCPGQIVLDGDSVPPPQKKGHSSPHFSAHVYCGQTAEWITTWYGARPRLRAHCVR